MATIDLAIIAALVFQAITGLRVGLVLGVFQLIVLIVGIALGLAFEEPVAAALQDVVPLEAGMRRLVAFFAIITAVSTVLSMTGGTLLARAMARQSRSRRVSVVDRALGLIPALIRGAIYAGSLVFMARLVLPAGHDIREQLDASRLAALVEAIFEAVTPYARMF